MGTRSVFVMCWRIKMPRLNNASLWQNTTDISVQIPYRLPRTECKHFRVFFFCFASLNFNLVIASALSLMCSERSELIFLTIQQSLGRFISNFYRSVYIFRYCNSHLQVLGIVPKKNRRKKPSEGCDSEVNSSSSTSESKARTDVLTTPASTNMSSNPPQLYPFRLKKPKNVPQKRTYTNIPAIEELRDSRRKWQKDRADLFKIYGKNLRNFVAVHAFSCFCTKLFYGTSIISNTRISCYNNIQLLPDFMTSICCVFWLKTPVFLSSFRYSNEIYLT